MVDEIRTDFFDKGETRSVGPSAVSIESEQIQRICDAKPVQRSPIIWII